MSSPAIDIEKVKFGIMVILFGGLGSYFGQPYIHNNSEAINIIVTVFSILAGFLIAVITLVGDPASLPSGSWRKARFASDIIYERLEKHKMLFLAYLMTLSLIFLDVLIQGKHPLFVFGLKEFICSELFQLYSYLSNCLPNY